jgi:hypothetical protein
MKVLFKKNSEYQDGPMVYLNVNELENEKNNLLYCYGIDAGYRLNRPDPNLFKYRIYFEGEEPNGFCLGQLPHERGNWTIDYWTKVLHLCPYTAAWENAVYNTDKFELANFFFNQKYVVHSEKIYDVCYIGGTQRHTGDSIFGRICDVINKFPNYRLVSRDNYSDVTDRSVSYFEKLKINSQCKISVVANILHTPNSSYARQQSNHIKNMDHWELNEAFKMIDYGIMPQIKGRVIEAAANKSLVLVLKDEWNVIEHFHTPNEHFLYFDSIDKLEDKINECLNNWDFCEKIIDNMYNNYIENYTLEKFYQRHLKQYDI